VAEQYPDEVKRIVSAMTLHAVAGGSGKWVAIALADGRSDNVAYDTRDDAIRHMRWDRDRYMYLQVFADGIPPKVAQAALQYARMLHDNGYRLPDPRDFNAPDHDFPVHAPPALKADRRAQILELTRRKRLVSER
jgi:hypothetical protein